MDQDAIRRQVASLQAQVFTLGDSLAAYPAHQRALAAEALARIRDAVADLSRLADLPQGAEGRGAGGHPESGAEWSPGTGGLTWTEEQTTRLYAITTALSVAYTQSQAAYVVVEQALPALAADAGAIMVNADGGTLKPIAVAGSDDARGMRPLTLGEPSPYGQAALTAQAVWIETHEELVARYGSRPDIPWEGAASLAALPLIAEGGVLGVMAFWFVERRTFTIADRAFMLVLAQQCAAALERVHLYEQVRQAAALEERNRLARDLHDSVSQTLYAIALAVTSGRANLNKDLSRVARALDNIESLAGAAQADLRALLFDLRADSVSRTGLVNAILQRAQFMRLRHNMAVRTELCPEPALVDECKEALYGIAREALHNAAKHARAGLVEVKLGQQPNGLVLEISDDGLGFEPAKLHPGHYGLQSMRERAAELGAELSVESAPGRGTRVVAVVPDAKNPATGNAALPCAAEGA